MITLEQFASRLRECREVVAFTGAGISTESGIPDFRSPGGVWTRYAPITFEEYLASEEARVRSWKRRKESYELYRNAKPNVGHYFIRSLDLQERLLGVITQNVDGLHGDAGVPGEKIVELHGSNRRIVCVSCSRSFDPDAVMSRLVGDFSSPVCDVCGGILKAATISFGQALPADAVERAQRLSLRARLFIVIGSSLQVQPAASFPVLAKQSGALLAIVNRDPTPLDRMADFVQRGEIGEFCQKLGVMIADG